MPSLKEVKIRITSVTSTQQITKAMKMVAAAKLRRSQERITQIRPFAEKIQGLLRNLSAQQSDGQAWYSQVREKKNVLLVVISSDRGLCGGFNSAVIKATVRRIQEHYNGASVSIMPLGKKANEFFAKRGYNLVNDHFGIFQELNFSNSSKVSSDLMERFRKGSFDHIEIIYNHFRNVATQILTHEQFLPVQQNDQQGTQDTDYIFQPDRQEIVNGTVPKSLHVQLFKALLDSNAAENGARMTAKNKATENAGELLKDLRLTYNRTRQAAITKEILEIVAGAEALKG